MWGATPTPHSSSAAFRIAPLARGGKALLLGTGEPLRLTPAFLADVFFAFFLVAVFFFVLIFVRVATVPLRGACSAKRSWPQGFIPQKRKMGFTPGTYFKLARKGLHQANGSMRFAWMIPILTSSLLLACGDDQNGSGAGNGNGSGMGSGNGSGNSRLDMGGGLDGGVDMGPPQLTCDPVDDTGCSETEICGLNLQTFDDGVCIVPAGSQAEGQSCDVMTQDCDGGLICGALPGDPTCVPLCELMESDRGCAADSFCQGLQAGDRFGVCIDSCELFQPDSCTLATDCGPNEACFDAGGRSRQCLPTGDGLQGSACQAADDCQAGLACIGGADDARCEQICNSAVPDADTCCPDMLFCLSLVDGEGVPLDFGFCGSIPECNLFDVSSCAEGQACGLTGAFDFPVCIEEGTGAEGNLCGGSNGCQAGLICVGPAGMAACREPCNMFNMCDAGFDCATLGPPFEEFGACVPEM